MLPTPRLDDRTFQQLVDDAKRMVQERCPEWTDHNVSDPGVTLIETVAFMVDELLYRVNRIPDRLYVAYLELLGVTLRPPTAATTDVTFWLSAPRQEPLVVPAHTEVSTMRTEHEEAVVFATEDQLVVPPRRLTHVGTRGPGGGEALHDRTLLASRPVAAFSTPPRPGDALYLGLDDAAPSCAVVLRFVCQPQGIGVIPKHAPIRWEAWSGGWWSPCTVDRDDTGGLNKPGDVVLHLPPSHTFGPLADTAVGARRDAVPGPVSGTPAGWLRCRLLDRPEDPTLPYYEKSPIVTSVSAFTIGGTVGAVHAETVRGEALGTSDGVPGQVFTLQRTPIVAGGPEIVVETLTQDATEVWTEVRSFAGCGQHERVFRLDRGTGTVHFPPAVRQPNGDVRQYGAVPVRGAVVRVPEYRAGGGPHGNVAARTLSVLKTSLPLVHRVENRQAARGGVDGETVDEAKTRGPLTLQTRDRAVTASDFEQLTREAAPEIERVHCVPAGSRPEDTGAVRVLVVPAAVPDHDGQLRYEDVVPSEDTLQAVTDRLDAARLVGSRILVQPPVYQGVTVEAQVRVRPRFAPDIVEEAAVRALNAYFNPLTGGPDHEGWPFGRPVQIGEVYAILQAVPGTEFVEDVQLYAFDPVENRMGEAVQRIPLDDNGLVFCLEPTVHASEAD